MANLEAINQTASLSQNNSMSLMVFKMVQESDEDSGNKPFLALNIFKVKEVLASSAYPLTEMPGDSNHMLGMIDVREEEWIPIYELSAWMGYEPVDSSRSVYLIAEVNGKSVGFHVAHITGVEEKTWEEIIPAQHLQDKVVNQTQINNELCYIVDVEKMVNEVTGLDLEDAAQVDYSLDVEKQIYFADDQESIRKYVGVALDNLGIRNTGFKDGLELMEALERGSDDVGLVITDLEMPRKSGHMVIKEIKENTKLNHLPVIVHTSMTNRDSRRQASEMGADGFIGKIDTDELASVIKKHMQ